MDDKKETAAQPTVLVRRNYKNNLEGIEEEVRVLEVHRFITAPAEVSYSVGLTLNMGNYESVRVDVGIKMPCYAEEVDETFSRIKAWAEKLLSVERDRIRDVQKNPF